MNDAFCIQAYRGTVCENNHTAFVAVTTKTGKILKKFPHSEGRHIFLRSAAKPFQAYALYELPDAQKALSLEEWAIIIASHAASDTHLHWVQRIFDKAHMTEADLHCGPHPPIDTTMAEALIRENKEPSPIHNNCSGKHAGMIYACHLNGWDKASYTNPEHPLQVRIREIVEHFSGTTDIQIGVDGCGAPVFCLPLNNIAQLFAQLACAPEFATLLKAMITYPDIVGDPTRIDSCLMRVTHGNLVAKVGAEGVLGIGNSAQEQGFAIKMGDGNNAMRDIAVITILQDLGWLTEEQASTLFAMESFSLQRKNTQRRVIGYYDVHVPWML